ncbi:hypothetical protein, partial [Streptococcus pyogenes]|uniref:hypothetical protein n=1 Tax=Streptococcus pyogenes TaxID=1314 RepID=UPI003F67EE55
TVYTFSFVPYQTWHISSDGSPPFHLNEGGSLHFHIQHLRQLSLGHVDRFQVRGEESWYLYLFWKSCCDLQKFLDPSPIFQHVLKILP